MTKTVYLGADHGGYELKEKVKQHLEMNDAYEVTDLGTYSEESVDYPQYGKTVGEAVVNEEGSLGIVFCGSGLGIAVAANKVPGVVATPLHTKKLARLAREHNGANVLSLGGRDADLADDPLEIVEAFLTTEVDMDERHVRRRGKFEC